MPSLQDNLAKWTAHTWEREGHEWSPGGTARGTYMLWCRSILPRISCFLPAGTILEIAPGYGRWTQFLLDHSKWLIGVDVAPRCVEACRERFAGRMGAAFHVNDGRSLPMVADKSIDFAFSFDSLVHVEMAEVHSYLSDLARTLKPGAAAWLHHSNVAAYARGRALPAYLTRRLWRAQTSSARLVRESCEAVGLRCVSQELINFVGRGAKADRHRIPSRDVPLTDCVSTIVRPTETVRSPPTTVYVNPTFVDEWRQLLVLDSLYRAATECHGPGPEPVRDDTEVHGNGRLNTLARVARKRGLGGLAETVSAGLERRREAYASYLRERYDAFVFRHGEPIMRGLARRRCPDCDRVLERQAAGFRCQHCRTIFQWPR